MNLLTEYEAAKMLRVSTRTIARLRAGGKLRYVKGRPVRIEYDDLVDYIKSETEQCQSSLLQRLSGRSSTRASSKTQKLATLASSLLTSTQAKAEDSRVASALGLSLALKQKWRLQHGRPRKTK
jgi:excisionase family DNA binding protein